MTAHAGYRGEEYPRSFVLAPGKIDVTEIRSRWIGEDAGGNRKRYFSVRGSDGEVRLLSYDATAGEWYLEDQNGLPEGEAGVF